MTNNFLKRTFGTFRMQIRRLVILASLSLLYAGSVSAINLVPNPSFELMTSCPTGLSSSQIQGVTLWTAPTMGSPDYFHSCATGASGVSTPANDFGSQTPHSGQAYAGFVLRPVNDYREYLEIPLTAPLAGGVSYDVSFYVSLADASQWAVDKVGAYLSVGSVGPVNNAGVLSVVPQVVNPVGTYITNKSTWTLVTGSYVAVGGETHMIIGNFADNTSTTPLTGLGGFYPGSYYYIDDVSVAMTTTAAVVVIGGRVVAADGRGISKASVIMTDISGAVHRVLTNPFGYYRFDDVAAGTTVIVGVSSKNYTFVIDTRVVSVKGELMDVNFTAIE